MSLTGNTNTRVEIETISLVREGDGLADRVDERGPYMGRYEKVKVKPEERLRVMMKRFYDLRVRLLDFDSMELVRELDDFAEKLEERCLKDLKDYWKFSEKDARERYKRYNKEIQGRI